MEQQEKNVGKSKNSFLTGVAVGAGIVIILGGVYMLGASKSGKTSLVQAPAPSPTAPSPTAPNGPTLGSVKPVSNEDHIMGDANAKVVLVEYSDYECPFCQRFHPTMEQVVNEYDGEVAWVYRHFPLSIHAGAAKKAEASECVAELGGNQAFWDFSEALFDNLQVSPTALTNLAVQVGVSGPAFDDCLSSGKYAGEVNQSLAEGQQAGVTGTPGTIVIVDGEAKTIIPGALPYAQVQATIESVL